MVLMKGQCVFRFFCFDEFHDPLIDRSIDGPMCSVNCDIINDVFRCIVHHDVPMLTGLVAEHAIVACLHKGFFWICFCNQGILYSVC